MAASELPIGKLFIESNVLLKPKWMIDAAVSVGIKNLHKYRGFDGWLTIADNRDGDFSLIYGLRKPDPFAALFVGLPSPNKTPIVHELYLRNQ